MRSSVARPRGRRAPRAPDRAGWPPHRLRRVSRFRDPQHPDFHRLNASIDVDRRLWPQDIAQSRAHARMLAAREIVSAEDRDALLAGLDAIEAELASDRFVFDAADEDIHM